LGRDRANQAVGTTWKSAAVVALAYLLFGLAWVLLSDWFVEQLHHVDDVAETRLQSIKGVAFVVLSAVLVFLILAAMHERERRAVRRLAESEAKFRGVFASDMLGLMFWTPDGRISEVNQRMIDTLGYTQEDFRSGRVGWQSLTPAEFKEQDEHYLQVVLETGACPPFEKQYVAADGRRVPVLVGGSMIRGGEGGGIGWFVDISDRKAAEQRIHKLNAELRVANKLKDEFLATMSHELRTPVTAIRLWLEILLRNRDNREGADEAIEMIRSSAEQQSQLIDDLLDLSRIILNRLPIEKKPLRIAEVVDAALAAHAVSAQLNGVALSSAVQQSERLVLGDGKRLQQAVSNLLSNAIKFTPAHGRIDLSVVFDAEQVAIEVRDTGEGIPSELMPRLFDRFWQGDNTTTRRHGGLGIGLSIARHMVERHGGAVRVASEGPGKGSTFRIELPLLPASSRLPDPVTPRPLKRRVLEGVSVLVVEDEEDSRRGLVRLLSGAGASVQGAGSAAEAIRKLEAAAPDVILSDIGMPGEDGYSLIRRIRQGEVNGARRTPAIALTAYASDDHREKAIAAGFDQHIAKPMDPQALLVQIRDLAQKP
jgi:PAS domain S-box-containing protein